jgi:hypothetical protein
MSAGCHFLNRESLIRVGTAEASDPRSGLTNGRYGMSPKQVDQDSNGIALKTISTMYYIVFEVLMFCALCCLLLQ